MKLKIKKPQWPKLWHGDCVDILDNIKERSIDLIVTSPPYDNLRTYNDSLKWDFSTFKSIANKLYKVLKRGGVIVWVVGDATLKGSETGASFKQVLYFKELGLNIHDTMIYAKKNVVPLTHNRYEQAFEYMFVLSKGKPKTFNPIEDKPNKYHGYRFHGTQYKKDQTKRSSNHNKTKIKKYGRRHNIFYYTNPGKKDNPHPATFPIDLANDHIVSWSNKNDVILDPFMGSGTVGISCQQLNRKFIGIEKVLDYFELAKTNIDNSN